jgi:hypothetical protein
MLIFKLLISAAGLGFEPRLRNSKGWRPTARRPGIVPHRLPYFSTIPNVHLYPVKPTEKYTGVLFYTKQLMPLPHLASTGK